LGQIHSLNKLADSSIDLCVKAGAESGVLYQKREVPLRKMFILPL